VTTVGLVLAAGAGRRLGGPKALVRLVDGGPTLLETAVARVVAGGCDRVVVVVGAAGEAAAALLEGSGAQVVHAADWDEGMGASLRAGLRHLEAGTDDLALVTLVDLPDVTAEVVERVLTTARADGRAALVRAAYGGVPGHPVAIGRSHWAEVVTTARGDRGAREHLRATAHRLVECGDLATGRDLDTAGDLDDLQRG
jgi:nicotine blue oxidoreductase